MVQVSLKPIAPVRRHTGGIVVQGAGVWAYVNFEDSPVLSYPRPCTASENFDCCLENAVEAADNRADDGEGTKFSRFLDFTADVAECAVGYIGDITFK